MKVRNEHKRRKNKKEKVITNSLLSYCDMLKRRGFDTEPTSGKKRKRKNDDKTAFLTSVLSKKKKTLIQRNLELMVKMTTNSVGKIPFKMGPRTPSPKSTLPDLVYGF